MNIKLRIEVNCHSIVFSLLSACIGVVRFFSHSFWMLCLGAVPYGLGARVVDASINSYVGLLQLLLPVFFYIGITVGRGISGFITMKLNDEKMIWLVCKLLD